MDGGHGFAAALRSTSRAARTRRSATGCAVTGGTGTGCKVNPYLIDYDDAASADAEALSMTEFQQMFEMKFPDAGKPKRDVPTRAEYDAQMAAIMEKRRG